MKNFLSVLFLPFLIQIWIAEGFSTVNVVNARARAPTHLFENGESDGSSDEAFEYLEQNFPLTMQLLLPKENTDVWKQLSDATEGYTVFAPNNQAYEVLGEKRVAQLQDVRNGEGAAKMGEYHAVNEPVTAEALFQSGGVVTLGGVVDVGRSVSGGFFGVGGKEDGGVTINGAKVESTTVVGRCTIHEVDKLISPELLWRYMDQLRIPGSN